MSRTPPFEVNVLEPTNHSLEALALSCRRGHRLLFSALDLCVAPGQLVWLRGDNGRGKTSLLRILAGVVAPEDGEVRWFGARARSAEGVPHQPAYVAHANALKEDLTVQEALSFLADLSLHALPLPTPQAVHAALSRVSMLGSKDAQVRTLSQGQRRRVALARLLLQTGARIWLLDEPYDALDQASTLALNAVLNEHIARGGSIVLTSHQPLTADAPRADQFWLRGPGERSGWTTEAFDDMADKIRPPASGVLQ